MWNLEIFWKYPKNFNRTKGSKENKTMRLKTYYIWWELSKIVRNKRLFHSTKNTRFYYLKAKISIWKKYIEKYQSRIHSARIWIVKSLYGDRTTRALDVFESKLTTSKYIVSAKRFASDMPAIDRQQTRWKTAKCTYWYSVGYTVARVQWTPHVCASMALGWSWLGLGRLIW